MKPLRLALFGFGTVGQWLAEALQTQRAWLQQAFGLDVILISVATAHYGLISRDEGLDLLSLARVHGVQLRMESTVMSGTRVLGPVLRKLPRAAK